MNKLTHHTFWCILRSFVRPLGGAAFVKKAWALVTGVGAFLFFKNEAKQQKKLIVYYSYY